MATQFDFEEFRPIELQVPPSRPKYVKGFPFEFELGRRMVQERGSSAEKSKDITTQTSTSKSVEEVATEVMKIDKTIELFKTMAIVSLNMGNLTMEINILKNGLAIGEKEKATL